MLVTVFGSETRIIYGSQASRGVNAIFIDGRIRNKKYCAGYCNSLTHPGYLTDEMVCQHQCGDKECDYFCCEVDFEREEKRSKIKENRRIEQELRAEREAVMRACCGVAQRYEGVGIAEMNKAAAGGWLVKYAAICSFDEAEFRHELEMALRSPVELVCGDYSFDAAVELVF
jgi:hypothetical protein